LAAAKRPRNGSSPNSIVRLAANFGMIECPYCSTNGIGKT
jgi:hypothetical protein